MVYPLVLGSRRVRGSVIQKRLIEWSVSTTPLPCGAELPFIGLRSPVEGQVPLPYGDLHVGDADQRYRMIGGVLEFQGHQSGVTLRGQNPETVVLQRQHVPGMHGFQPD